ncbi:hypothetical protein FRC02_007701 [Tulasnella sp. 418]|nr:hypothetical protein FRC02_007701 [Tulasnella sp. 418]
MNLSSCLPQRTILQSTTKPLYQIRSKSRLPYGRSHIKKPVKLPNPVVPQFPQRVMLSDGSSFVHFTTSPKSTVYLNRDMTNNPFWSPGLAKGEGDDESGRLSRYKKRFGGEQVDITDLEGQNKDVKPPEGRPDSKPSATKKK